MTKGIRNIIFISMFLITGCFPDSDYAQTIMEEEASYSFIKYEKNFIQFPAKDPSFIKLFQKMNNLILAGQGQIRVLHIGDSHIQADMISGRIRNRLHSLASGTNAGRGFVFPCSLAGTNNPVNILVESEGKWDGCRNVEKGRDCNLGFSGISVRTEEVNAKIKIRIAPWEKTTYDFDRVKIFHSFGDTSFVVALENFYADFEVEENKALGYTEFRLSHPIDSLCIGFERDDSIQNSVEIYGVSLETDDPGILYHASGVNGAKAESYLRCNLLPQHLKALQPDLVIVSLGTNDVYADKFDRVKFAMDMNRLISLIKESCPETALLLTTPGDNYRFGKYPNKNTSIARDAIEKLAEIHGCAVWDFYNIMGGYNSIKLWNKEELTAEDKLHFSKKGYELQGDLFFNALLGAYDSFIDNSTGR